MFLRSTGSRWKHSLFYFTETAERSWKTSPSLVRYMAEMFPLLKKKQISHSSEQANLLFSNLHLPLLRLVLCKLLKHNASNKTCQSSSDCSESQGHQNFDRRVEGKGG